MRSLSYPNFWVPAKECVFYPVPNHQRSGAHPSGSLRRAGEAEFAREGPLVKSGGIPPFAENAKDGAPDDLGHGTGSFMLSLHARISTSDEFSGPWGIAAEFSAAFQEALLLRS
jgi:hypothetical protein